MAVGAWAVTDMADNSERQCKRSIQEEPHEERLGATMAMTRPKQSVVISTLNVWAYGKKQPLSKIASMITFVR